MTFRVIIHRHRGNGDVDMIATANSRDDLKRQVVKEFSPKDYSISIRELRDNSICSPKS
jgi:hypothetical protein